MSSPAPPVASTFVHDIIELNQSAVSHLLEGDNKGSIAAFQKALSVFREEVQHNIQECPPLVDDKALTAEDDFEIGAKPKGDIHCFDLSSEEAASTEGYPFKFYGRIFVLSGSGEKSFRPNPKKNNVLLSILLYNLANVHHREAKRLRYRPYYAAALQLYELAFATLEKVADAYGSNSLDQTLLLLLCGLYNNMGHIFATFADMDKTRLCLKWLQTVLQERSISLSHPQDYKFFSDYMVLSPDKQFVFAGAA